MPNTKIKCPKCGRPQKPGDGQRIFWCDWCKMQFDDEPEEGGSYFSDPTRRAELADERRAQPKRRK